MAQCVRQIRNEENNAHLLFQRPGPQPRVLLQQLLIAQAVLHRAGDVTHPKGWRSARCIPAAPLPGVPTAPQLKALGEIKAADQFANAAWMVRGPRLSGEASRQAGSSRGMAADGGGNRRVAMAATLPRGEGIKAAAGQEGGA